MNKIWYVYVYIHIYIYICRYAIAVDSSRSDLIVAMSAIANSWVDRLLRCWSLLGSHGSWLQVRFPRKWSMNGGIVPCFPYTYIYTYIYGYMYIYIYMDICIYNIHVKLPKSYHGIPIQMTFYANIMSHTLADGWLQPINWCVELILISTLG